MTCSATPELAAEVSRTGGLGSIGCGEMSADEIRNTVAKIRARTDAPFNLNLFTHPAPAVDPAVWNATRQRLAPWYKRLGLALPESTPPQLPPGFGQEKLDLLLALRPPVVSFHFGIPDAVSLAALRAAGMVIMSTATTVAEARALQAAGIDAIIAQGFEAGGHRGSHRPTAAQDGIGALALIPQVVNAVSLPIIAAGGIADGRGIAAALALGASGVQIGTGFLLCPEAGTDGQRRSHIANAADTDTMMSAHISGGAARARRSAYSEAMATQEGGPPFPALYCLVDPLIDRKSKDVTFHLYGQAASLARALPAAELVGVLVRETRDTIARLGGRS